MIKVNRSLRGMFDVPRVFFTVRGNPRSEEVIALLLNQLTGGALGSFVQECQVFADGAGVADFFRGGVSPTSAVVLFDESPGKSRRFSPTAQSRHANGIPAWAGGAHWAVKVGPSCTPGPRQRNFVEQLHSWFRRDFTARLNERIFPWGRPKAHESAPTGVTLPPGVDSLLARLNSGPDFAQAIAHTGHALELPAGSRISWLRVPPEPLICDQARLLEIMNAFEQFERASTCLLEQNETARDLLFAGVDLADDLRPYYLNPPAPCFSVRRPDLHFTGDGLFASENDEMPGGFADAVLLDLAYGINQEQWERCFRYLTSAGPLLFLVSHEWSRCYIPELVWLTQHLVSKGYPVRCLTTDKLDELSIRDNGVYHNGDRIGTIWRQFPIFEARGKLADVVRVAYNRDVRLVPEFSHFGNKTWFSLFRAHREFFEGRLSSDTFACLDRILPDSHLVRSAADFPCTVGGISLDSLDALYALDGPARDDLVLKLSGAHALTSRSYGVLMGHGLTSATWRQWLDERAHLGQPFIVQGRMATQVVDMPVLNTKRGCGESFSSRLLLRPWMINGEVVSVSACAVPSNTLRVHGRVDMALCSVRLE